MDEAESYLYCWTDKNSGIEISDDELGEAIWVVLESTDFLMEGIVVASLDETMQRFVPGRGSSVRDVLIDTAGVLPGVLILYG